MKTIRYLLLGAGLLLAAMIHAEIKVYADPDLLAAFPDKSSIEGETLFHKCLYCFHTGT